MARKVAHQEVQLVEGRLAGGSFDGADAVRLRGVDAEGVDFGGRAYVVFAVERSRFHGCSFDRAAIRFGQLGVGETVYTACTFNECDLRGIDPGDARFESCSFVNAKISDWMAYCAEFVDCDFSTRIVNSIFSATPRNCSTGRAGNEFRGNDFSRAELIETAFVGGIDLDLHRWPTGDEYVRVDDARNAIAVARAEVETWSDPDKQSVLVELDVLSRFAENQSSLFVRRQDVDLEKHLADTFWSLFE